MLNGWLLAVMVTVACWPLLWADQSNRLIDFSHYDVDEFKAELENYDVLAILFYVPYCDHCVQLVPQFKEAYETVLSNQLRRSPELNNETGQVSVGLLDCSSATGTQVCRHMRIKGFPTIKLFKFGNEYMDYEHGKFVQADILKWMQKYLVNLSKRYHSYAELNAKMSEFGEPMVIALYQNNGDVHLLEQWMKVAQALRSHWNYRDVSFCHMFDDYAKGSLSELSELGFTTSSRIKLPMIIIHKPRWLVNEHEKNNIVYDWSGKEDLEGWLKRKIFGSIVWRTRDNSEDIKPPLVVAYYDYDFKKRYDFSHLWRNRLLLISNDYVDVTFAISSSQTFRKQLRRQGLPIPERNDPPLIWAMDAFGSEYVMRKQFTDANVRQFVDNFKSGQLKPYIGSLRAQKPVANDDPSKPMVVVTSNFPQLVTHNAKDVLIMFYVPWCKHSRAVLPLLDELCQTLMGEPNLNIAKMDLQANESPPTFTIQIYPTIYLIPAHSKQKVLYSQGPQLHQLVQFVAKHVSFELHTFDRNGFPKQLPSQPPLPSDQRDLPDVIRSASHMDTAAGAHSEL